jgi:RNA-directed DNA polymerase
VVVSFDSIDREPLLRAVRKHTQCRWVLLYIERWLKASAMLEDGTLVPRDRGTPQGGVSSPLLANLYMNRFLKYWRLRGKGQQCRAKIVAYADDFVILSRGYVEQARECAEAVMSRIGLTLHEQKTRICDARTQDFDSLGYAFGPRWWWKTGRLYPAARPSEKRLKRRRKGVQDLLRPSLCAPWEEVRD